MTKQFIKLISLIMAIIVFPFSVPCTFAYDNVDDRYMGCYEELLGEVGVVIGESEAVTRGDFLKAVMTALSIKPDSTASLIFSDISDSELNGLIPHAINLGIISEGQNFYPDTAITYPQACKIVVEALGWGNEALYGGGYPTGYTIWADRLELDDGVIGRDTLSKNDVIRLLGNMMETSVRKIVGIHSDGKESFLSYESSDSFMYVYHDIYKVSGVIEANDKTYIGDSTSSLSFRGALIGGTAYFAEDGVECNVGSNVDAYVKEDGSKNTIVCITPSQYEKTIVIYPEDLCEYNSGNLTYYDGNKEKTLRSDSPAIIYNGKAFEHCTDSDFVIEDGYIEAVDNDSNGKIDTFRIWEAEYSVVSMYDTYRGIIHDLNTGGVITLNEDGIVDSAFDMRDIENGDVLEIYSSKDGMYRKIVLLKKDMEATITGIESDGKLLLDDIAYGKTGYFEATASSKIEPGITVSVMLTSTGKLAALLEEGQARHILAYLDNFKEESGIGKSIVVKMFNEFGELKTLSLSAKATIDGQSGDNTALMNKLSQAKGNLIKYLVNAKEEVVAIYTQNGREGYYDHKSEGNEALIRYRFPNDETETRIYYKISGYFVPHFIIDSSTRIICVAENESDDSRRFSIGNGKSFLANDTQAPSNSIRPFNVSSDGYARYLLYKTGSANVKAPEVTASYGVVVSSGYALDDDGDAAIKVTLYADDGYNTYYIDPKNETAAGVTFGSTTITLNKGDVIRYSTDTKGEYIESATQDFDVTNKKLLYAADHNRELHYYYGDVYSISDRSIGIKTKSGEIIYLPFNLSTVCCVDTNDVYTVQKNRITTYEQVGDKCSKILVKCRYSDARAAYVYE